MKESIHSRLFQVIRERLDLRIFQTDVAKKLLSGGGISAIGGSASKILNFIAVVYVSRQIGGENFGIYIYFQAALMFFCLLFSIGLATPATTMASQMRGHDTNRLKQIILFFYTMCIFGGLVGTLLFILVGIFFFPENVSQTSLNGKFVFITSLAILCLNLDSLNHAFLFGLGEVKKSISALVVASTLGLLSVVILVDLFGMDGAMLSIATLPAIQLMFSGFVCFKKLKADNLLSKRLTLSYSRILLDQGIPTMLLGLSIAFANWAVQTIIVASGSGLTEVGVFGIGQQAFQIVVFVPIAFGRVILPLLAKSLNLSSTAESASIIKMSFILSICITLPVCFTVWLFANEFLTIFGDFDAGYVGVIRIMAIAAAISSVIGPVGTILIAKGKYWLGFTMNVAWASVYILASLGMSNLGVLGVSYALLAAFVLHSIWTLIWFILDVKRTTVLIGMEE